MSLLKKKNSVTVRVYDILKYFRRPKTERMFFKRRLFCFKSLGRYHAVMGYMIGGGELVPSLSYKPKNLNPQMNKLDYYLWLKDYLGYLGPKADGVGGQRLKVFKH